MTTAPEPIVPELDLAAWNAAEGQDSTPEAGALLHVLGVAGYRLVIQSGRRTEIAQVGAVARLPFSPPWFEGLANHRGNLIPVYDLQRFLVPDQGPGKGRYLVIFGEKEDSVGVRAEELSSLILGEEGLPPATGVPPWPLPAVPLARAFRHQGTDYFEPDIEALLLALGSDRPGAAP